MNQIINGTKLRYLAEEKQFPFFFTKELLTKTQELNKALGDTSTIAVYPDATIKANKLPTGTACIARTEDAMLLPFLLRDPGCGYLTFKFELLEPVTNNWHHQIGELLEQLINKKMGSKKSDLLKSINIEDIVANGLAALNLDPTETAKFLHSIFDTNTETVTLSEFEKETLTNELITVTNTVEIRSLLHITEKNLLQKLQINNKNYIGFIHTGSHFFPAILGERFVYQITKFAHENGLFSFEDMKEGIVGVPYKAELGQQYAAWLNAAMNYALVNRYLVFQDIKQLLETTLPCRLTIINDNIHAGFFTKQINGENISYSTRGIQSIFANAISLLAGQRETIAALVTGGEMANDFGNLFSHGTGYHIRDDYDYSSTFSEQSLNLYQNLAKDAFYNSVPNWDDCIPHTYNLLQTLNFFQQAKICKTIATLAPLINIQSDSLKQTHYKGN